MIPVSFSLIEKYGDRVGVGFLELSKQTLRLQGTVVGKRRLDQGGIIFQVDDGFGLITCVKRPKLLVKTKETPQVAADEATPIEDLHRPPPPLGSYVRVEGRLTYYHFTPQLEITTIDALDWSEEAAYALELKEFWNTKAYRKRGKKA